MREDNNNDEWHSVYHSWVPLHKWIRWQLMIDSTVVSTLLAMNEMTLSIVGRVGYYKFEAGEKRLGADGWEIEITATKWKDIWTHDKGLQLRDPECHAIIK